MMCFVCTCVLLFGLCLLLVTGSLALYSGLLAQVTIRTGPPPLKRARVAYKLRKGRYRDCRRVLDEAFSVGPKLPAFGIFYDHTVASGDTCHYAAGSILSEGDVEPSEQLKQRYEEAGFTFSTLPEIPLAVSTSFPCKTSLAHYLMDFRVYRAVHRYMKERELEGRPAIEIHRGDSIDFMFPLVDHNLFYVKELRPEAEASGHKEDEDVDEDAGGPDEGSIEPTQEDQTNLVTLESHGTSVNIPTPERPVPQVQEEDEDDQSERNSGGGDSEGSGSPFEELDLEPLVGNQQIDVSVGQKEEE